LSTQRRKLRLFQSKLRQINPYCTSAVMIAFAVIAALNLPDKTAFATAGIILLMAVLASAAIWGLGAGLIASGFAALAYDFFSFLPFTV
jgi:K+-sensing histidine kinase KdpD